MMGRVLEVSRSGYYAQRRRSPSATAVRRQQLVETIRQVHGERPKGNHGSPRMTKELQTRGVDCSENWVAKVMKHAEIRAKSAKRWIRTTDSNHRLPVAENVLERCVALAGVTSGAFQLADQQVSDFRLGQRVLLGRTDDIPVGRRHFG